MKSESVPCLLGVAPIRTIPNQHVTCQDHTKSAWHSSGPYQISMALVRTIHVLSGSQSISISISNLNESYIKFPFMTKKRHVIAVLKDWNSKYWLKDGGDKEWEDRKECEQRREPDWIATKPFLDKDRPHQLRQNVKQRRIITFERRTVVNG
jgi:hypothetical protein